jgi:hypothetical protein
LRRYSLVEDLRACFALSDADRALVFAQRGAANRLGLAVQLCALRFLGFVPQDLAGLPAAALDFLAGQVDAAAHELLEYGARPRTRVDHLARVREHLGYPVGDPICRCGGSPLPECSAPHGSVAPCTSSETSAATLARTSTTRSAP